jgi:hypothetical protein
MTDPLVVLVFLAPADAFDPAKSTIATGAERYLHDAVVIVRERPSTPTDAEVLEVGDRVHATNVASVVWEDSRHERVRVHLHRPEGWFDHAFSFTPADAPSERGRAIGLILASMIAGEVKGEEVASETVPSPPPSPAPTPGIEPPRPEPAPSPGGGAEAPVRQPAPTTRPPIRGWGAALASAALDGAANGLGPSIELMGKLREPLRLRIGGAARFGRIDSAGATSLDTSMSVGPALALWRTEGPVPLDLSLAVDFLAVRESVDRARLGIVTTRSRWISGADAMLELGWRAVGRFVLLAHVGGGIALGVTPIQVGDTRVATIPALRAITDLGIGICF